MTFVPTEVPDADRRERMYGMFKQAPGFICALTGPDHVFEFVNDAYSRLFGRPQIVGMPVREAFPELEGQGFFELLDRVLDTGERYAGQAMPIRLRGTPEGPEQERFLNFIYEPLTDEGGRVIGVFCEGFDVTEQKQSEADLRESEQRYREIVEGAHDFAIVTVDPAGMITSWNTGAETIIALDTAGALGRSIEMIFTPEDRAARVPELEMQQARTYGKWTDERWHLRHDGTRFWGSGLIMALGERGFLKMFRDATGEQQTQAELQVARAAAEALAVERTATLGQLIEGVIVTNTAGRITFVNEAAELLHGVAELGVEPHDYSSTYHLYTEDGRPYPPNDLPLARAVRGVTVSEAHWRIRRPDGTEILAAGNARPIIDADGTQTGAVLTLRDETLRRASEQALCELNETLEQRVEERTKELMETQDALRQSQKLEAIGQLTGGVAHDFNNLLTVIRGSADILKRSDLSEEKRNRYIEAIAETSDRAAKLTSQLLAFARRQSLKPGTFDVVKQLEGISDVLRTVVGSRVSIDLQAAENCCFTHADPNQFETAVVNMMVNGRDAMQGEGRITIKVAPAAEIPSTRGHEATPGEFVCICFSDSGCGIDPQDIERIFDPFFTTKEVGQGTGLGLSQVFGFAKQSGGEILVDSEVGEGTTFMLYLPRAEADTAEAVLGSAEQDAEQPRDGLVLVVEDNNRVGEFASHLISDLGYRTVRVPTAAAAIKFLEEGQEQVDVVFTDVVMPGMSGVELASELRERMPSLPVILTSGYSHVLAEEGSHGFPLVQKPYSAEMVAQALNKALMRRT